jgi:hypothetical protein
MVPYIPTLVNSPRHIRIPEEAANAGREEGTATAHLSMYGNAARLRGWKARLATVSTVRRVSERRGTDADPQFAPCGREGGCNR